MSIFEAIILGTVEGITEFLPISSTGHMIIAQYLLNIPSSEVIRAFIVSIQFGTILSVLVLYCRRFFQSLEFYKTMIIAFLPAAVAGFLMGDLIDALLNSVLVVALALIIGGAILLKIDTWLPQKESNGSKNLPSPLAAFKIGLFQIISMIPGVSRSASTIIGGMTQGLSRKTAAEFSFFLAVPTMFGAAVYELSKTYEFLNTADIWAIIVGNVTGFLVAMIAIKFFIEYLSTHSFKAFGWYRITVGIIMIVVIYLL